MAPQASDNELLAKAVASIGDLIRTFPENIREALKPYQDPAKLAREARERKNMREDLEAARVATAALQAACPHKDKNERWAINVVHNHPDRQPRGICPICNSWIFPAHWVIGAPTEKHPRGEAYIVQEHPLYHVVRFLESQA